MSTSSSSWLGSRFERHKASHLFFKSAATLQHMSNYSVTRQACGRHLMPPSSKSPVKPVFLIDKRRLQQQLSGNNATQLQQDHNVDPVEFFGIQTRNSKYDQMTFCSFGFVTHLLHRCCIMGSSCHSCCIPVGWSVSLGSSLNGGGSVTA